jgi:biopolymer transport protein TolR
MITAPMMTVGVKVELPQTSAPAINDQTEPLVVTLKPEGSLYIQETLTAPDALVARLKAITFNKKETKIYLRADKTILYGKVMEIMGLLAEGGFTKVALIGEQKK